MLPDEPNVGLPLFPALIVIAASIPFAFAENLPVGGSFSTQECSDSVLYTVRPFWPRHAEYPKTGCSVSVRIKVLPSGKIEVTQYSAGVDYKSLRPVIQTEPAVCSNGFINPTLKALKKAQFAVSDEAYHCTYTYRYLLTD
jgi:hypothetical protein